MTTTPKPDVLATLNYMLELGDFFSADYTRFRELIPRIAALVDACGPLAEKTRQDYVMDSRGITETINVPVHPELHKALSDLGR